jgi:Protein of unknown function (DUF2958)
MQLLTIEQHTRLLENGRRSQARINEDGNTEDFFPVAKLFTPWAGATWLLTELDPDEPDIAFGLCNLGLGSPELGSVRLSELQALHGPGGLSVERDLWFTADRTLSAYAAEARALGRIKV